MAKIIYSPGVHLKEELDARSEKCESCGQVVRFTQQDLAKTMGIPARTISEIIQDKRPITLRTAKKLGKALGTSTEFWLSLQHEWDIFKLTHI